MAKNLKIASLNIKKTQIQTKGQFYELLIGVCVYHCAQLSYMIQHSTEQF